MRHQITKIVALGLSISLLSTTLPTTAYAVVKQPTFTASESDRNKPKKNYRDGEAIVRLKPNVSSKEIQVKGIKAVDSGVGDTKTGLTQLYRSDTLSTEQMIEILQKNPKVVYAEPNYMGLSNKLNPHTTTNKVHVLNDTVSDTAPVLTQSTGDSTCIWDSIDSQKLSGKTRIIALLDSGIDPNNESLMQNLWTNTNQGILPGEHGYNVASNNEDLSDTMGYGTAFAQLIRSVAANQLSTTTGNCNIQFLPLKIYDEKTMQGGDEYTVIKALDYIYHAKQLGADISAAYYDIEIGYFGRAAKEAINKIGKQGVLSVVPSGTNGYFRFTLATSSTSTADTWLDRPVFFENPYIIQAAPLTESGELLTNASSDVYCTDFGAPAGPFLLPTPFKHYQPEVSHTKDVLPVDQSADQSQEQTASAMETTDTTYLYRNYDQEPVPSYRMDQTGMFHSDEEVFGYPSHIAVFSSPTARNKKAQIEVTSCTENAFGHSGSCLKIEFAGLKDQNTAIIAIPYQLPANQKTASSVNMMVQLDNHQPDDLTSLESFYIDDIEETALPDKMEKALLVDEVSFDSVYSDLFYGSTGWNSCEFEVAQNDDEQIQKRYLLLKVYGTKDATQTIYLDNLGISKGLDEKENETFGNYRYFNQSDAAAAYTTGALALLTQLYPDASAAKLRNLLRTSVTQTNALQNQTKSGGMLDLNKITTPVPVVDETTVDTKGNLCIKGSGFIKDQTTVTINRKNVQPSSVKEDTIIVAASSYQNTKAAIRITTPYGSYENDHYLPSGKKYLTVGKDASWPDYSEICYGSQEKKLEGSTTNNTFYDVSMNDETLSRTLRESVAPTTDGTQLYFYNCVNHSIDSIKLKQDKKSKKITDFVLKEQIEVEPCSDDKNQSETNVLDDEDFDEDEDTQPNKIVDSDLIYLGKKIYFLLDEKETNSVYHERNLYCIDLSKKEPSAKKVSALPKAMRNVVDLTLTNYKGSLYLLGGYDYTKKGLSKAVYCLDPKKKKISWKKSVSLPEGRAKGSTVTIGNCLYYTLGVSKKDSGCPTTLVFNGKKWTKLGSPLSNVTITSEKKYGSKTFDWYTGRISAYNKQLIFTGISAKGLGDTFTQNIKNGKYKKSNYNGLTDDDTHAFLGTVVGDNLVGFYASEFELDNSYLPLNEK